VSAVIRNPVSRFSFNLSEIGNAIVQPLAIVMPIYNEEGNIVRVITSWSECLRGLGVPFQFIALDDGSKDGTHAELLRMEAERPSEICVVHKPNSGHGMTCRTGYDIGVRSQAEWILQIDSDGQCDPSHFPEFWSKREGHDCVFGVRKSRDDGFARKVTSTICRLGSSLVCGQDLRDPNVPYRLIRRTALARALQYIPSNFNIHNVALTYVLKKLPELRWDYVPIHFPDRQGGTNSINVLQVVTWGAEMLLELLRIKVRPAARPT
jgi:glycosyltransferase involved in cell wall biosynthesis